MLPFFAASFVAFGVVLVLPGVHQADLARALSLDLARSGLLASALAAGLGAGVIGAGPLFDRMRRRPLFVIAFGIAAAALLSVRDGMSFERWLVHVAAAGFGIGFYDTLINAAVAERYRAAAARPMSLVHAAATLGAMAGPLLAALVAGRGGFVASFHWAGAAHVVLGAWACGVAMPGREAQRVPERSPVEQAAGSRAGTGADPATRGARRVATALLPLAAVAFAYVGVEASLTVFAVPYATGALALSQVRGAAGISALWLGLLLGRVGVLALPNLSARTLVAAGALAACALLAGVALRVPAIEATFLATGVALGCVYPLTMALVGERIPQARGTAAGLAAGAGALGGSAVPWLTGTFGDAFGVSAAVGSLAAWCAVIALAAGVAREASGSLVRALLAGLAVAAVVLAIPVWGRLLDRVVFQPTPGVDVRPEQLGIAAEDTWIDSEDGVRLHAFQLRAPEPASRAILMLHGNAGNASHRLPLAAHYASLGADVLLLDYRGYGLSAGRPSERGVYADARAALAHLASQGFDEQRVVLIGHSLGGAIAVDLAQQRRLAGVVLESTFSSLSDLARGMIGPAALLLRGRFDSVEKIARLRAPLLSLHGDRDEIVPFELGRTLFEAAPEPKRFETLRGSGHNDTAMGVGYFARIGRFLDEVAPR